MAGILHYLDFNPNATSRKLPHSHKRHNDGLEAPRNSVEFAMVHEDIPYCCHTGHCSKQNLYPKGTSMRKLIELEISSKTTENSKRPSVVARLMGMDPLPGPISPTLNSDEEFSDEKTLEEIDLNPQRREKHPQEEELQKFKTQFEAWQSNKLLESSRNLELENFGKHKFVQSLSLQQKNKGKQILPEDKTIYYEEEKPISPTKIVILKPCPEMIFNNMEESNIPSPEIIKRENNIENFLEEVKNKLKLEIEGKSKTDPKQIARNIANQIRETVVQDINNNKYNNNNKSTLARSESARWYQTGTQFNKDTRKLLSEKIKNVLKREIENISSPNRTRPTYDIKRKGIKPKAQIEQPKYTNETEQVSSPRNLIRSFSAPVSGTGFVKLLSELEVSSENKLERKCEHERKGRKEVSERSGKAGNLRQNQGLRKWLFGKRIQSADEQTMEGFMPAKSFNTTPSVVVNSGFIQENFTEVPPSPASVCNSPRDDICKEKYPSPVSPLDAYFIEENSFVQVSQETFETNPCKINEDPISDQVNLTTSLDSKTKENLITEENPIEEELTIENHAKSYVKTLLVTAGLYKSQPFTQILSRWDNLTKPIPKYVFEQTEEGFKDKINSDDCETAMSHEMLFDLTNEALPSVLGVSSSFNKWVLGPVTAPHGKRLLDGIWGRVEKCMRERGDWSLDELIYEDLRDNCWQGVFNEEMGELGVEIELELVEELIDELFWDVMLNIGEIRQ